MAPSLTHPHLYFEYGFALEDLGGVSTGSLYLTKKGELLRREPGGDWRKTTFSAMGSTRCSTDLSSICAMMHDRATDAAEPEASRPKSGPRAIFSQCSIGDIDVALEGLDVEFTACTFSGKVTLKGGEAFPAPWLYARSGSVKIENFKIERPATFPGSAGISPPDDPVQR